MQSASKKKFNVRIALWFVSMRGVPYLGTLGFRIWVSVSVSVSQSFPQTFSHSLFLVSLFLVFFIYLACLRWEVGTQEVLVL